MPFLLFVLSLYQRTLGNGRIFRIVVILYLNNYMSAAGNYLYHFVGVFTCEVHEFANSGYKVGSVREEYVGQLTFLFIFYTFHDFDVHTISFLRVLLQQQRCRCRYQACGLHGLQHKAACL